MQLLNESQIFEQWAPMIENSTGITDKNKLSWMSKYAHYHKLNEGFTYPQASLLNTPGMGNVSLPGLVAGGAANFYGSTSKGSGDKFPSLLPIAIQVAARTVGFDIVPVVPMAGPSGMLTYLDYAYVGGRDPFAPGLNGQTGLGGTANAGSYKFADKFTPLQLNSAGFDSLTDLNAAPTGDYIVLNTQANSNAFLVKKVGKSRINGYPLFRLIAESNSFTAASASTFNGIPEPGSQNITYYDVINDTSATDVYINSATTITVVANPNGTYTVTSGAAADATFNDGVGPYYVELVKALEDHVQGFAGAGPQDTDDWSGNTMDGRKSYEPMRRGIGETTQPRTMGLQLFNKAVEAQTLQVNANVTNEQIQDLNRQFGIDALSGMENALINEVSQSINKHILSRTFALGWQNHYNFSQSENVNLNLTLNPATTTGTGTIDLMGIDPSAGTISMTLPAFQNYSGTTAFENQGTIQRRIQSKVLAASNVIVQRGRRGPGTFIVTNTQIATALQDNAQFTLYPMANTITQNAGALYPVGRLAGMIVYVDPNMDYGDTRVLVGRKGADDEPGIKFCPYLMAESYQTIAEGTMAPKIMIKSRYSLVEAGFHPETQYFTFLVNLRDTDGVNWWDVPASGTISIA